MNCKRLFIEKPDSWGLRGDPFLWDELEEYFAEISVDSSEGFTRQFKAAFLELAGEPLVPNKDISIRRYDPAGMSGGHVSTDFWIETGLPLLISRIDQKC